MYGVHCFTQIKQQRKERKPPLKLWKRAFYCILYIYKKSEWISVSVSNCIQMYFYIYCCLWAACNVRCNICVCVLLLTHSENENWWNTKIMILFYRAIKMRVYEKRVLQFRCVFYLELIGIGRNAHRKTARPLYLCCRLLWVNILWWFHCEIRK